MNWSYGVDLIDMKPGVPRGLEHFTSSESLLLLSALEEWGIKGWELVTLLPSESGKLCAVFKKPKDDD